VDAVSRDHQAALAEAIAWLDERDPLERSVRQLNLRPARSIRPDGAGSSQPRGGLELAAVRSPEYREDHGEATPDDEQGVSGENTKGERRDPHEGAEDGGEDGIATADKQQHGVDPLRSCG
jgi:hypothetical protein